MLLMILSALGCNHKEPEIKEEIEIIEELEPHLRDVAVSPEQGLTLWIPEISNDSEKTEELQLIVGNKMGMPPEINYKLEVYLPGNRCALVRDPLTKLCTSLIFIENDWKILEMGMNLTTTQVVVSHCYYKDGTMNDMAKNDEAYRGFLGVVQKYCNG
jgi:hypothetical protein